MGTALTWPLALSDARYLAGDLCRTGRAHGGSPRPGAIDPTYRSTFTTAARSICTQRPALHARPAGGAGARRLWRASAVPGARAAAILNFRWTRFRGPQLLSLARVLQPWRNLPLLFQPQGAGEALCITPPAFSATRACAPPFPSRTCTWASAPTRPRPPIHCSSTPNWPRACGTRVGRDVPRHPQPGRIGSGLGVRLRYATAPKSLRIDVEATAPQGSRWRTARPARGRGGGQCRPALRLQQLLPNDGSAAAAGEQAKYTSSALMFYWGVRGASAQPSYCTTMFFLQITLPRVVRADLSTSTRCPTSRPSISTRRRALSGLRPEGDDSLMALVPRAHRRHSPAGLGCAS